MRQYVAIRTDKDRRDFILREFEHGRLRQGWGWLASHDLRKLKAKVERGGNLSKDEASVWRNRRLLDTEEDGLKDGDIVIAPNLPEQGQWVVARVVGPYRFDFANGAKDYGHIVQVEPWRTKDAKLAVIKADNEHVDARLRASMNCRSRMWSLDPHGGAIEALIQAMEAGADTRRVQPATEKLGAFLKAMRSAAWANIKSRYEGAEFEHLVVRLFSRIYEGGRVVHTGGAGERGADILVFTEDALGLEYKVAVQVKLYEGEHDDLGALDQIKTARAAHKVHAGVVVTTAERTTSRFDERREELEVELGIEIHVIDRDELTKLLMRYLGADGL